MAGEKAYTTRERMYQLGLRREAFKGISGPDQDEAILTESSVIDLYLVRFSPPLASVPLAIERIAAVRSAHRLMRAGHLDPAFTSTLAADYDEATKMLEDIASGKLGLAAIATDQTPAVREAGAASWSEPSRGWSGPSTAGSAINPPSPLDWPPSNGSTIP